MYVHIQHCIVTQYYSTLDMCITSKTLCEKDKVLQHCMYNTHYIHSELYIIKMKLPDKVLCVHYTIDLQFPSLQVYKSEIRCRLLHTTPQQFTNHCGKQCYKNCVKYLAHYSVRKGVTHVHDAKSGIYKMDTLNHK